MDKNTKLVKALEIGQVNTIKEIFSGGYKSLAIHRKDYNEETVLAKLVMLIAGLNDSVNVDRKMNDKQTLLTAKEIIKDFYWLTLEDFRLCFMNLIKGQYGQIYGRLDIQIIYDGINQYNNDRLQEAETISMNEAKREQFEKEYRDMQKVYENTKFNQRTEKAEPTLSEKADIISDKPSPELKKKIKEAQKVMKENYPEAFKK